MRFYTHQHQHYCGIDLPARALYVCLLDQAGTILVHKNVAATPEAGLRIVAPYREDLGVAVECLFTWQWLADLWDREGIAFVLGHALSMKASHGGTAKNDKLDAHKIAVLLRGGRLPQASVSPPERRATRELLRRRCHVLRTRAELRAHLQNTNRPYNLPEFGKKRADKGNRDGVAAHCPEPSVRKTIELDLTLLAHYDKLVSEGELSLTRTAKGHAAQSFACVPSVPGRGPILARVIRQEIPDLPRFPRVPDFVSSCRLVKCATASAGKRHGLSGQKIGNPQLTGAFSEAAVLCLRQHQPGKESFAKRERHPGKGKALTVLAPQLARAVSYLLTRKHAFALQRFVTA